MYETTQDFINALDRAGELRRIKAPASPVLEITEIVDRVSKSRAPHLGSKGSQRTDPRQCHLGGSALLFENVAGSDIPVLINAWGSYRRVEMALGCEEDTTNLAGLEGLAERVGKLVKPEPPPTLLAKLRMLPELIELAKIPPRKVKSGVCQEVVRTGADVDLTRLPLLRCWPMDGDYASLGYPVGINDGIAGLGSGPEWERDFRGRYITLGGVHTIHVDDEGNPAPASRNIGMYRVQLLGRRHAAMHWHMHHDGARHWRSWKAKGKAMPVAIALGGESVLPYAATAPMPPGISELLLAGFLNRGAIPLVRCKTVPIDVPANSEIVIEGYVDHRAGLVGWDPKEMARWSKGQMASREGGREDGASGGKFGLGEGAVFEGPFGDHTGFYSLPDRYPLLEVTAITHRRNPVFPATIVGLPPQEDYFLGKATERLFLPLLRTIVADVIDYDLPMFGAFHNAAFLKIRKEYPLHARRVMHAIWGAGQMSWTKTIVVVDENVDVHDSGAVLRAVGEHCEPARDCELVRGPVDILDHAAPFLGVSGKLGLDATRKTNPSETHRSVTGLGAELCKAGPIPAVEGDAARATETRVRAIDSVLDARVPEELGGHWLLIRAEKREAGDGVRIIKAIGAITEECALPRYTIVVGADADLANFDSALFHWMASYAPDRDRNLSLCGRRVAFDATPKLPGDGANGQPVREFPPLLRMSEEVRARVSARWMEYGL
ncbi:MAG: UbiD family decarboxylase [Phycisphaerae bacterium]|nr:UbiD family decarboxylase [Phycisphaerae bacterium]